MTVKTWKEAREIFEKHELDRPKRLKRFVEDLKAKNDADYLKGLK